jgi:acyl-coenzyme A synthetase/AMP-(fatty) acid ligase
VAGFADATFNCTMNSFFCSDIQTLLTDRPDDFPVAYDGARIVRWSEFYRTVQARRRPAGGERRRILLADQTALGFLAHLLAIIADDDVAVIPPNFQPHTLQSFALLPSPDTVPPATLELYTSGSTGEPKCVRKSISQLEAECRVQEACWGEVARGSVVIATTPYHHIYGLLFRLLWPLYAGRPFDNTTITEPTTFVERLTALKNTVLVSSPAQLSRLPELLDLAKVAQKPRLVLSSGGPLSADTAQCFAQAWNDAPVEVFGSTESGGIAWRRQTEGPCWTPLPGVAVSTAPDGALLVRSPFLPDQSELRMEDAAEIDSDGRFVMRGRLDRIVKIEEKRLSLPEMEAWLATHAAVTNSAMVPIRIGERTVVGAVVVTRGCRPEDRKTLVAALKDHLRQKYDNVLLPRRWRFVEQLPYNERGKLAVENLVTLLSTPL